MADSRISDLTAMTVLAAGDLLECLDISDTSMAATGTNHKITLTNFLATLPAPVIITSAAAAAFSVGPAGDTNPVLRVVANTASQATGLSVTGNATGAGVTLTALDSGANSNINIVPKGTGGVVISGGSKTAPILQLFTDKRGFYAGNGGLVYSDGTTPHSALHPSGITISSDNVFGISSGTDIQATSSADLGISRVAANVLGVGTGGVTSRAGWLQWAGEARMTADATKTDTTFANLTDLTISNLIASRKYFGRMIIKCNNSQATEGIKLDFNGGSATIASFWAVGSVSAGGTTVLGTVISTSLAGVINFTTITGETLIAIDFSFVVNGAGTLIPRFAENSTAAGTTTVELGSFIWLHDSPN